MAIVMMGRKFQQPLSLFYGDAEEVLWEAVEGGSGVRSNHRKMLKGKEMGM